MGTGIELVVSDLDGTFWELDHEVHPRTLAAAAELDRRGVDLLVATGRRLRTTQEPLARVGLSPPAVVLNGALGLHLGSGERFHLLPLPTDRAVAILAAFRAAGLEPCIYVDHPEFEVYLAAEPSTHPQHAANLRPFAGIDELDRVCAEEVVLGFSLLGLPHEVLADVVAGLDGQGVPHLDRSIEYAGFGSLTVTGPGMSKWEGVLGYCRHAGIDPGRILAIGDGPNDLELLAGAAVAVAPSDGHVDVVAAADHVVGPARDGGWADLLDLVEAVG
jgi:hydroxymethylpyrimidine pyrophosphatase-like HAD family hydrolase